MPYNLSRFVNAQQHDYAIALAEITAGRKQSHWIWYIFPQLRGLGRSSMSDYYGIADIDEARAYLADPTLSSRLIEICSALLALDTDNPTQVMGRPDDMKLRSSMTLFMAAATDNDIFKKVINKFFNSKPDYITLQLLGLDNKDF